MSLLIGTEYAARDSKSQNYQTLLPEGEEIKHDRINDTNFSIASNRVKGSAPHNCLQSIISNESFLPFNNRSTKQLFFYRYQEFELLVQLEPYKQKTKKVINLYVHPLATCCELARVAVLMT